MLFHFNQKHAKIFNYLLVILLFCPIDPFSAKLIFDRKKKKYWHTQPVHLISPSLYPPDTLIRHFSHSPSGKRLYCCLSRTSGTTTRQCGTHPHLYFNSQFVSALFGRLFQSLSSTRSHSVVFVQLTGSRSFWMYFWLLSSCDCHGLLIIMHMM